MAANSELSLSVSARVLPARAWRWGALALVLLVAGYFLYGDSLVRVVKAYRRPEFSHGYIIPLIAAWLIWQRRALIRELRDRGAASGLVLVAGGLGIALLAQAARIVSVPYLGLLAGLLGLTAAALGWRAARLVAVPLGIMVFGLPLPDFTYVRLSTELQLVSSQIGAGILRALDIPVLLSGNIIDLGIYRLQVAEACSGLRYLLPLLTFGVLCAYVYRAPIWAKLAVVALTVPLTILLNGARIALTGIFVAYGSTELAEGFMHLFEGWVVFLIALACLFAFMWLLAWASGRRRGVLDLLDFDRMAGEPEGRRPVRAATAAPFALTAPAVVPRPFLFAVALVTAAALALVPIHLRPQHVPDRPGLIDFPLRISDWHGTPDVLDPTTREVLSTGDHLLVDYTRGRSGDHVNLWVAYYDSLLRRDEWVHLPTTCLPGAGWEYVELGRFDTGLDDLSGRPLVVNRGVVAHGQQRVVLYFWLELRGRHAVGQEARLRNLWDSIVHGRSDGGLVRVFTPLEPGEAPADGDARLRHFLERAYPHLEPHLGA